MFIMGYGVVSHVMKQKRMQRGMPATRSRVDDAESMMSGRRATPTGGPSATRRTRSIGGQR